VPFEFYITNSPDELGNLLNFEFFYAGYTSGVCLTDERLLLSGKGSPWYPHELVHMAAAGAKRHAMIEEGFATWLGGQNQMSWERSKFILKEEIAKNQEVTFNQVIEGTWGNQAAFYTSGALLCQAAFDKGGDPAVEQLLTAPTEDEAFKAFLCEFFNIPPAELSDFWRSEVMK
jgi:hypothetical protein